ncbi:hypothetical protein BS50DRAFT_583172 [Corynespora cassiicola Philippines]|uniref:Uncharacterized protein n=1 Tax=Corynespora cassiicola Philippines TaxID=1448308 RepID=A0A2T2P7M2_CORCC|nr:hypothetical protein BS50DRAFT_583172 [Corynespora cassiicola Philippines]
MAGESLEPMSMSPRRTPAQLGNAVVLWAMSPRGRVVLGIAFFVVVMMGLAGGKGGETLSASYQSISQSYHLPSWRPHLPHLPQIFESPLKPSNTTLEIENGEIEHVPAQLTKQTPSFHLLMPSLDDSPEFCKTTLSAMLLGYPPPTVINLFQSFNSQMEREKERLQSTLSYLNNTRLVKDQDLVLVVDGHDTWFQLPPEVIIKQYQNVLNAANKRLRDEFGLDGRGEQRFNQTIVFGAEKSCEGEDMGCKYVPESPLPSNIYGKETGEKTELTPAKYLDAGMLMGPAKDLKVLYEAAVKKFEDEHAQSATVQSVFATMFGEQQLSRKAAGPGEKPDATTADAKTNKDAETTPKSDSSRWLDWFGGQAAEPLPSSTRRTTTPLNDNVEENDTPNPTALDPHRDYDFAIGLDYHYQLFQPFLYCAPDELAALVHDNSTDLALFHHPDTPTPPLSLPNALLSAKPPFWTPDLSKNNPSPNSRPAYIDKLAPNEKLDRMRARDTQWAEVPLVQNTYTGSTPAVLHLNQPVRVASRRRRADSHPPRRIPSAQAHSAPSASITWSSLWYSTHERALLRSYFRTPQSALGFHAAATGGDRLWDQRGGRGGVWTAKEEMWMPWGEVDGVCGSLQQVTEVFGDGRGVWLHEGDEDAEGERRKSEEELREKIEEERKKEEERKQKEDMERAKKEEEDARRKKEEERKKIEDERKKQQQQQEQGQGEQESRVGRRWWG